MPWLSLIPWGIVFVFAIFLLMAGFAYGRLPPKLLALVLMVVCVLRVLTLILL